MKPEPHKLHLDAMRLAIADVRLAAGELLREIQKAVRRG